MRFGRHDSQDTMIAVFGMLVAALVIGLLVYAGCAYYRTRVKCTDNGGHWESYNCRTTTNVECQYNISLEMSVCLPQTRTHCDERCVGVDAEAR